MYTEKRTEYLDIMPEEGL